MTNGRIGFDTDVSASVQGDIQGIIGRLESLMGQRDQQVATAMSDFQADGVSDEYHAVEQRWKSASTEVRGIISLIRETLGRNDETAIGAQTRARTSVQNIG
ncbi:pore-forming ESAT-6 family protein [Nocardioides sp. CFH 31398]|uniref:pore-forming ESAT-6 family protein n=1 Tax=Nocardioides sp. CFH 31398 TaxID=2919579 RepID=UPI001F053712|nr:pore-forming ESAT-6 family protein [Nocardioides sp. CFH 31398]MCH1865813.1 pore-forming ESAT-6 family protein [Nocardioides sp. CFH 31398]